jgi:hypothetical protein
MDLNQSTRAERLATQELEFLQHHLDRRDSDARVDLLMGSLQHVLRARYALQEENTRLRAELEGMTRALARTEEERALFYATVVHNVAPNDAAEHAAELANGNRSQRFFSDRARGIELLGHLLRPFGLDRHWCDEGLCGDIEELRTGNGPLSLRDRVLLIAAHDLLSEDPSLAFLDIVEHLRGRALYVLLSFIVALDAGHDALGRWVCEMAELAPLARPAHTTEPPMSTRC